MDTIKRCVYFNNYPYIKQTGELRFCCKNSYQHHGNFGNIKENTLREMYDNALFLSYRDKMSSGEELPGCEICYQPESNNNSSFRTRALNYMMSSSGLSNPPSDRVIRALDLRVGNTCNLKCLMCHPSDSNSWHKIYGDYSRYVNNMNPGAISYDLKHFAPENLNWAEYDSSWENIFCSIDENVRLVYISGGEPFYLKNFGKYITELNNRCKNTKFSINSNATRLLPERYAKEFRDYNIDLRISLDGIGSVDEYVRQGTVWQEKVEVIRQYHSIFSSVTFDITLSAFNIKDLPNIINWIYQNYPRSKIFLRHVTNRPSMKIELVPFEDRKVVYDFLNQLSNRNFIENLQQILNILSKPTTLDGIDSMSRTIKFFDMNGDLSYSKVDKGLSDYVHKHSSS